MKNAHIEKKEAEKIKEDWGREREREEVKKEKNEFGSYKQEEEEKTWCLCQKKVFQKWPQMMNNKWSDQVLQNETGKERKTAQQQQRNTETLFFFASFSQFTNQNRKI